MDGTSIWCAYFNDGLNGNVRKENPGLSLGLVAEAAAQTSTSSFTVYDPLNRRRTRAPSLASLGAAGSKACCTARRTRWQVPRIQSNANLPIVHAAVWRVVSARDPLRRAR